MTRRLSWLVLVLVVIAGVAPMRASSLPVIQGQVSGIELCQQSVCGSAIFVAVFSGQAGASAHALGTVAVAVTHDPLPDPEETAAITGGVWQLQLLSGRRFAGIVTAGTLFNNGDNTYHVVADMLLTSGGIGTMTFEGTLNHNTFPPTIVGQISQ